MVFDVGRDVFVMRMRGGQRGVVGVGLRIVPVQFLATAPNFVAITGDATVTGGKTQGLGDDEDNAAREFDPPRHYGRCCPNGVQGPM